MGWLRLVGRRALDWVALPFHLAMSLTRAGWFVLVMILLVMLVALRSRNNVPFLMAMVMLAVVLGSAYLSRRALKDLLIRRGAPRRAEAGVPFKVFLSLSNMKRIVPAFAVHVVEQLLGAPWLRPALAYTEAVPAGGSERSYYTLAVRRRGIYQFAPTRLESSYPFGFFRSAGYCAIPTQLIVYPRMMRVSSALFEETDRRLEEIRAWRRTPYEEDFRGLREYRHGDNPKWIHWRSSARLGTKLVREFEKPESKRITMLLETLVNPRALNPRRRAHLETGVRFAASLGRECLRRGYDFTFRAWAPEEATVAMGSHSPSLEALLDVLARLAPSRDGTVGQLLARTTPAQMRDAVILVVRLGFAGVGEGADEELTAPPGVPPELFWEATVGTGRFRGLFGRGVVR